MKSQNGRTNLLVLVGLPVILVLVVGAMAFQVMVAAPTRQSKESNESLLMTLTGLDRPVTNRLGEQFVDANEDLVADAPADATKALSPKVLRFSYVPTAEPERYEAVFAPLLVELGKATGREVQYALFETTEDQLRAMRDGFLHVAGFNTGSVPVAVNQAGFVPVAVLADASGPSLYETKVIVPAASTISKLADLKKKTLVLTDPSSNSGFKAPLVSLKTDNDLRPERDYLVRYSGGHDQSIEMIASGSLDGTSDYAAAVASDLLARAEAKGTIKPGQYRVIGTMGKFPPATFGYAHNLDPAVAAKLTEALKAVKFEGSTAQEFGASSQIGLAPVVYKSDFALVRKLDDMTGNDHKQVMERKVGQLDSILTGQPQGSQGEENPGAATQP